MSRIQAVQALYQSNPALTAQQVAEMLGVNRSTIMRDRKKLGLVNTERRGGWKGGRHVNSLGYVEVWVSPDDPLVKVQNARRYALEHRVVMARHLGRTLRSDESVHHIDGDRQNNKIENLQLRSAHHGPGQVQVCGDCGSINISHQPL